MNIHLKRIEKFYSKKFQEYGPEPKGLDWNDLNAQEKRLNQIIKFFNKKNDFRVNDFGCGYGHLVEILRKKKFNNYQYYGYDISNFMINFSKQKYKNFKNIKFVNGGIESLRQGDYTIASGVFNKMFMSSKKQWEEYVFNSLEQMYKKSDISVISNFLTNYSDKNFKRSDLYYASPEKLIKFSSKLSKFFSLHHDYGAYDFLIKIDKRKTFEV